MKPELYTLSFDGSFEAWRQLARRALQSAVPPEALHWYPAHQDGVKELFRDQGATELPEALRPVSSVPREFLERAQVVAYHRSDSKWELLYRLLWRLTTEGSQLMAIQSDPDVLMLHHLQRAVTRDAHKMKAFVRFRRIRDTSAEHFVAWHRPDHPLLRYVVPFFQDRFHVMRWTIFTPDESVAWDGERLHWGPGCPQHAIDAEDQLEELWTTYYASIFNPARVKIRAMKAEMAVRYWSSLPEAALIPDLLEQAPSRVASMLAQAPPSAASLVPKTADLPIWRDALHRCAVCTFAEGKTAIEGEGPEDAPWLFLVPEVHGPRVLSPQAEAWLRASFAALGLPWELVRITAVVKHPKSSRIERKDLAACKPWLGPEIARQKPQAVLGAGLNVAFVLWGRLVRWQEIASQTVASWAAPKTRVSYDLEQVLRAPEGPLREEQLENIRQAIRLVFTLPSRT